MRCWGGIRTLVSWSLCKRGRTSRDILQYNDTCGHMKPFMREASSTSNPLLHLLTRFSVSSMI